MRERLVATNSKYIVSNFEKHNNIDLHKYKYIIMFKYRFLQILCTVF